MEISSRVHTQAALREPYYSRKYVADVGVLVSQNTHDFWGHIPGTTNLEDYHDGLLGTWMLLSENHVSVRVHLRESARRADAFPIPHAGVAQCGSAG